MDSNNFNGTAAGMPGAQPTGTAIPPMPGYPASGGQPGKTGKSLDGKIVGLIAVAAAVVVVAALILIVVLASGGNGKVEKAVKTYIDVFITGETKPKDVNWGKYYPKDMVKDIEDWAEDLTDDLDDYDGFRDKLEYEILSVTKLKGDDNLDMVEDYMEEYEPVYEQYDADVEAKDFDVDAAYFVLIRTDERKDTSLSGLIVVKSGGKYSVEALIDMY